jgi:hypothetical protein
MYITLHTIDREREHFFVYHAKSFRFFVGTMTHLTMTYISYACMYCLQKFELWTSFDSDLILILNHSKFSYMLTYAHLYLYVPKFEISIVSLSEMLPVNYG